MASLQAKADAAKTALASTSTCTTATVVTLKELLLPDIETSYTASQANSRTASKTTTNSKAKRTAGSKTQTAKSISEQLSSKDRAALATHVINICIRSLNEAAKPTTPATPIKQQASQGDSKKTSGPRTLRRSYPHRYHRYSHEL
ncbi:separin protein [Fusarium oxysporum]|nr:separin protein [Fusarium oxysporum]